MSREVPWTDDRHRSGDLLARHFPVGQGQRNPSPKIRDGQPRIVPPAGPAGASCRHSTGIRPAASAAGAAPEFGAATGIGFNAEDLADDDQGDGRRGDG